VLLSFAGMTISILIIFMFQQFYGYLYQAIGLIITAYMGGLALGSFLINSFYKAIKSPEKLIRYAIMSLILLLILFFETYERFNLPLLALLAAIPLGMAFPLVIKTAEKEKADTSFMGGVLYGADLFGGGLAALIASMFLIPIFGILNTLGVVILFCLGTLFLI
jgi:spermidine synthase